MEEVIRYTQEADIILKHANMSVKKWIVSGASHGLTAVGETADNVALDDLEVERTLGVLWDAELDTFRFTVRINLSPLKKKARQGPDLSKLDLQTNPPVVVTRRQYYSQIQSLFDPIGFLAPILLKAKLILRKTWEDTCQNLRWDDPLPRDLVSEIVNFFLELFDLEGIKFDRSLWPREKEVIGRPELIIFSDGSKLAFGAVAYIRWQVQQGSWWVSLIMSKSKIAPKNVITIPRLELNGAVLSKRLEEFLLAHLDLEFQNIYHLVDSSTVLGYIHKPDSKLKPFEGVRVSEIQTAGKFTNGRLHNWAWVDGINNPADWATKPRCVKELGPEGFWQKGPSFLTEDYEHWPIKLDFRTDKLDGELQPKGVHYVFLLSQDMQNYFLSLLERVSSVQKLFRIVGLLYKVSALCRKLPKESMSNTSLGKQAEEFWIKLVQKETAGDLEASVDDGIQSSHRIQGRVKRLSPFRDSKGIW